MRATVGLALLLGVASAPLHADETYRLRVDGLFCPYCAYGVEKALRAVEGVKRVEISLEATEIVVIAEEGARLDEARARRAVSDGGFTLRAFERVEAPSE